jgi:hypothetical protein
MSVPGRYLVAVAAILLCLHAPAIAAQSRSADPFVGTWLLNRAQSQFVPGPPPEKRTVTIELVGEAFKEVTDTSRGFRSEFVAGGGGGSERTEYTAKFDGQDYPISNSGLTMVSLKRVNARTIERTGKVGGKPIETSTRAVSADGKHLTITTKGDNDGTEYSSVQVYDRAKP